LMDLATGYWKSAALSAAVELNLFDVIEAGHQTATELAARLNVAPDYLEPLLDALASLRLVEKREGRYGVAPEAERFLCRSSPDCLLDALRLNVDWYPLWGRLANSIREGRPAVPSGAGLGEEPERTRRFVWAMHSRARVLGPSFVPHLNMEGISHLLDLGAGPGTISCLLAERYSGLRVTLFDLPPVLQIAKEIVQRDPVAARILFHPGDYHRDDLPADCDAVLYCGGLHRESSADAARLMRRVFTSLRPGGKLFVVDLMVDEDRTSPAFSALFSLTMMLTRPSGRVWSEPHVRQLLSEAGFCEVTCHPIGDAPYRVISGCKSRCAVATFCTDQMECQDAV
jgi:SAM-dependent methyltransferase